MKRLTIDSGLLLTDIELTYRGNSLVLHRVLVDTGSGSTIISSELAETIGIIAEENDMIFRITGVGGSEFVFSKTIDNIKVGKTEVNDFVLEVGAMNYGFKLDGIIGLDLLQEIKAIINIDKLTLECD
ncbi:retropepsin-like aspartic protease [Pseudogracilibacillus sp. SO30301A]|uniref:retropepsin-like aspartic protease n=1 Tax=Pseudogracilibacillus sp. SO30301A TaxID=3098291 RepID=UPI00300E1679